MTSTILHETSMTQVTFYFDVGSPYAYLAAERVGKLLGESARWQPVLLGGLFKLTGRSSWALGDSRSRRAGMAEIERRARDYRLPPVRWPDPWPADYLVAMRATTFAFSAGHGRRFALQAFRRAFRHGVDLSIPAHVFRAAREAGLDQRDVERAIADAAVKHSLRDSTEAAHELGVVGVPTIAIGDELFWGDDRLEDATAHLQRMAAAGGRGV